jgi:hypothetical protein
MRRSTKLLVNVASPAAATYKVALGAPGWADKALIKVLATTDGTGGLTLKAIEDVPTDVGTEIDIPGAAIDAIGTGVTNGQRYLALGLNTAVAGTSFDAVVLPITAQTQLSYTVTAVTTNLKVWVEFIGE